MTIIIIVLTGIISFTAFSNHAIIDRLIFYPPAITEHKQWYRFITCGFIHADLLHLMFNMFSLYAIGQYVEMSFDNLFAEKGKLLYILLYITSLAVCLIPTYLQQKNNYYYRSLGASGAVSAVVFIFMFLYPQQELYLFFVPIGIPGFIFGPIYLIISSVLAKKGHGNINHSAHIWGAVYGVVFVLFAAYLYRDINLFQNFLFQVKQYLG